MTSLFTVRPLPPTTSLDGAFRVHLTVKDLGLLGLQPNELCIVHSGDGSSVVGIAWRSLDTSVKPQTHPVKLSEVMRDAFGIKLGSQITIEKINAKIVHADRVVVTDVSDREKLDLTKDDENWKNRCAAALGNVEAITAGVAFEVSSRKGLRKRFLIQHIESSESKGPPALYVFDDKSQIIFQGEADPSSSDPLDTHDNSDLDDDPALTTQIAGLDEQIATLRKRIRYLFAKNLPSRMDRNAGIILHGASGTGKTLLLNHLSTQAPWKKVLRIDQSTLAGTPSKTQLSVRNIFAEAVTHQPSLVIMDNLEAIAGTQQRDYSASNLASTLAIELDKLQNTRVLTVAAVIDLNEIDKSLRTAGRLRYEIEIPIPDAKARTQILNVMQGETGTVELAETIGERTHGFVGQDLKFLFNNAIEHALDRYEERPTDWLHVQPNGDDADSQQTLANSMQNCSIVENTHTADSEDTDDGDIQVTLLDYEKALLEVRPTAMREIFLETPKVLWSEIGGSSGVKQTLHEAIDWPLHHAGLMERFSLTSQKGILFYGPPGCAKTLTAKAVATESGLNFIAVKGAELTSMYVGESERSVREVFRKARAAAPSIIFFDEIDSIGSARDSSSTKGLNVLTTLLNEMDGIESLKGVLVLAATNKPEILDSALLRPGRFDSLIYISLPSQSARKEILNIRTNSVPLTDDVDIDDLAVRTEGFSGSEIVEICLNACRAAMRRAIAIVASDQTDVSETEQMKVSKNDFDIALSTAVRRITPEMVAGFQQWADTMKLK
ncbi:AAA-domain-containing protein [Aureobasidium sp. EXF-10728]|nr:AAA-domain-containing protein [Aureobasidium sp. EXF-10728]